MKYQKFMKKVMQQLGEYKGIIDSLSSSYLTEKTAHEEELRQMQGKYTEEYIAESRRNWKPKTDYGKAVSMAREKHQKIAFAYSKWWLLGIGPIK